MIFPRTDPPRVSKTYRYYRPYLRRDFLNRCAYCLRHEFHFGGEANGQIDHFCPQAEFEKTGELHLRYTYTNLFWSCGECNNTKEETWPSHDELKRELRFVDSSRENTDQHWEVLPTGEIRPLTQAGRFTIDMVLLWRDDLNYWRKSIIDAIKRVERLQERLNDSSLTLKDRSELQEQLNRDTFFLSPAPFNRPPMDSKRLRQ